MPNDYNKNPRRLRQGIEDFSLKALRIRGNKSPTPPVLTAPRGWELNPRRLKQFYFLKIIGKKDLEGFNGIHY
jgi:hypothetical protein